MHGIAVRRYCPGGIILLQMITVMELGGPCCIAIDIQKEITNKTKLFSSSSMAICLREGVHIVHCSSYIAIAMYIINFWGEGPLGSSVYN